MSQLNVPPVDGNISMVITSGKGAKFQIGIFHNTPFPEQRGIRLVYRPKGSTSNSDWKFGGVEVFEDDVNLMTNNEPDLVKVRVYIQRAINAITKRILTLFNLENVDPKTIAEMLTQEIAKITWNQSTKNLNT